MCYTNILQVLDLAKIPLLAKERGDDCPIVIGGGPCTYNPEPIADFFDIFYIGEGETQYRPLIDLYKKCREEKVGREEFLRRAAKLPGMYVPRFYETTYHEDGTISSFRPTEEGISATIRKELVTDMTDSFYPMKPVVPYIKVTQDRVVLEIQRGCIRGCRFCQAAEYKIFWKVAVPSAGPGLVAGTILTFARALGEYGATSMLAGNIPGKTGTISQRIAMVIQDGDYMTAGIWVVIIMLVAFVLIFLMNLVTGRNMKNIRRW